MSRPPAVPPARAARHSARALAALAALALAAPPAGAQTATLRFSGLTSVDDSGIRNVANCYEEAGFRVTLAGFGCGTDDAFATWTPDNDLYYAGSPALYNNYDAAVDFTAVSGQTFAFQSIGLASFLGQLGNPTSVLFTGLLANGSTVSRSVSVPGGVFGRTVALSQYDFTGFTGLRSLRLAVTAPTTEPYVQFDNVTFNVSAAVVPEPATLALFGAGLAGLGAAARRRQRAG